MGLLQKFLENLPGDPTRPSTVLYGLLAKRNPHLKGPSILVDSVSPMSKELTNLKDKESRLQYMAQLGLQVDKAMRDAIYELDQSYDSPDPNASAEAESKLQQIIKRELDRYALALNYCLLSDPDSNEYSQFISKLNTLIKEDEKGYNTLSNYWPETRKPKLLNLEKADQNNFFVLQCAVDAPDLVENFEIEALKLPDTTPEPDLPAYLKVYALSLEQADRAVLIQGYESYGKEKANNLLMHHGETLRSLLAMFGPHVFQVLATAELNNVSIPVSSTRNQVKEQHIRRYFEAHKNDVLNNQNITSFYAHITGTSKLTSHLSDARILMLNKISETPLTPEDITNAYEIIDYQTEFHDSCFTSESLRAYKKLKETALSQWSTHESIRQMRNYAGLENIFFKIAGSDTFSLIAILMKNNYHCEKFRTTLPVDKLGFLRTFYNTFKEEIAKDYNVIYFVEILSLLSAIELDSSVNNILSRSPDTEMSYQDAVRTIMMSLAGLFNLSDKLINIDDFIRFKNLYLATNTSKSLHDLVQILSQKTNELQIIKDMTGESLFEYLNFCISHEDGLSACITQFTVDINVFDTLKEIYKHNAKDILSGVQFEEFQLIIKEQSRRHFSIKHPETKQYILEHLSDLQLCRIILFSDTYTIPSTVNRSVLFEIIKALLGIRTKTQFGNQIEQTTDLLMRLSYNNKNLQILTSIFENDSIELVHYLGKGNIVWEYFLDLLVELNEDAVKTLHTIYNLLKSNNPPEAVFQFIIKVLQNDFSNNFEPETEAQIIEYLEHEKTNLPRCFDCIYFYTRGYPQETMNPKGLKSFLDFKKRFELVETKVENREQHGWDFYEFFDKFDRKIYFLVQVMSSKAFDILSRYGVMSNLPLERELDDEYLAITQQSYGPLQELFTKHENAIMNNQQHKAFITFIKILSAYLMISESQIPPEELVNDFLAPETFEQANSILIDRTENFSSNT